MRAWPVRRNTPAVEAAGTIHSDIQRGFIRAEIVAYNDLIAAGGPADAESLRLAQLVLAPSGLWAAFHYWRAEKYIVEDQKRAIGYV